MSSLLELIFQGFIEWLYSLVLECWNWFSTSLLDIMSLDLAYIRSHVPIITDIMQVLLSNSQQVHSQQGGAAICHTA